MGLPSYLLGNEDTHCARWTNNEEESFLHWLYDTPSPLADSKVIDDSRIVTHRRKRKTKYMPMIIVELEEEEEENKKPLLIDIMCVKRKKYMQ
jgi:hypothetical protein